MLKNGKEGGGKKIVLYERTQRFIDPPTPPIEFVHVSHIKYIDVDIHRYNWSCYHSTRPPRL